MARVLVPEERLNFDTELAATAALDMARRYADADGVFLAGGEDLLTALSGKIGQSGFALLPRTGRLFGVCRTKRCR